MLAYGCRVWSPKQIAAASAHKVWCGTVGTIDCRYEHEPEIPLHTVVLSRWPPTRWR
jgi:hypothetical protein